MVSKSFFTPQVVDSHPASGSAPSTRVTVEFQAQGYACTLADSVSVDPNMGKMNRYDNGDIYI